MGEIEEYIKCQKFILKSELQFTESNMGLDIYQSDFALKAIDCIFDSVEKLASEIEKLKQEKS
ncbi:MAG: hypothetical protein R6U35_06685 [Candidatus Humimicrobiaceae bacterium]